MCINDSPSKVNPHIPVPVVCGQTYKKIRDVNGPNGVPHYELEGIRVYVGAFRFAPISDIDETEFERNYKKELV